MDETPKEYEREREHEHGHRTTSKTSPVQAEVFMEPYLHGF